jgi:hypothetical protein
MGRGIHPGPKREEIMKITVTENNEINEFSSEDEVIEFYCGAYQDSFDTTETPTYDEIYQWRVHGHEATFARES